MTAEPNRELATLLADEAPNLRVQELTSKSLGVITLLLWANSIGAFAGLWKVLELWTKRYAGATVKMSYTAEDGRVVEVEYSNLTKHEVDNLLAEYPMDLKKKVKLITSVA